MNDARRQESSSAPSVVPRTRKLVRRYQQRFASWWPSIAPQDRQHYRGRQREILAILGNRVSWPHVNQWDAGRALMPLWARERIIAALSERIREAQEIIDRLNALPPPGNNTHRRGKHWTRGE